MTDVSFSAAGNAVLIEDDPMEKYSSMRKTFAPVAFESKTFSPIQLKMSIYAIFFAFEEFGHIFWGTPKPLIILIDKKMVTRFFKLKLFHPPCGTLVNTLSSSISRLPKYLAKTTPRQTICLV